MVEYIDLETGKKCRDEDHANELYQSGHRIRTFRDGVAELEWIPGSNDYYSFWGGKKHLVKYTERGGFSSEI